MTPDGMRAVATELSSLGSKGRVTIWETTAEVCERLDKLITLQKEANERLDKLMLPVWARK